MRLNQDQVRELSNAIASEQGNLLGRVYNLLPSEQRGLAWWRSLLDPRRVRGFTATLERSRTQVNELLSDATGVDAKAAELELDALRRQLFQLWSEAIKWQQQGLVAASADEDSLSDFVPAGFPAATEALLEFYFGNARAKDTLVAETQLAWIAAKQISPSLLSRKTRERRRRAYQRYSELWATWAKATHPTFRRDVLRRANAQAAPCKPRGEMKRSRVQPPPLAPRSSTGGRCAASPAARCSRPASLIVPTAGW